MTLTANSKQVYEAVITHPLRGAWTATLQVDSGTLTAGQRVTIQDGSTRWVGTVSRAGDHGGRCLVSVVGGAGGLSKSLPSKWYRDVTVGAILDDLARESGETLSSTISATVSNTPVSAFTRQLGQCPTTLEQVLELLGAGHQWRVLNDGTVWVGVDTWATTTGPHVVTEEQPHNARVEIAPEQPFLAVGTTFLGRRVVAVQYNYTGSLRACVSFEDTQSSSLADVFRDLVARHTKAFKFFAAYTGKVITQHNDGTLDIELDSPVVPSPTRVPIRYGIPGVSALVNENARVLVNYENGDEHKPVATLWEQAAVKALEVTSTEDVIINGRAVKLKKTGGRSIAAQGDTVRVVAASPIPGNVQIILGPVSPTGGPTFVLGWLINGIPSMNLVGQISGAFSPNKS